MKSIQLIVQYYRSASTERQLEIDTCLGKNLENPLISTVHLLTEELFDLSCFPNHNKLFQTVIGERLTYEAAFRYANAADTPSGNIWILANADIYFDETLNEALSCDMTDTVFALSRYECDSAGGVAMLPVDQARGGQDSWFFTTPLRTEQMFTSFFLGIPCCDYRINYKIIHAGYYLINPSLLIRSYHLDLSGYNVEEKSVNYMAQTTLENISAGNVAPPPYHHGLYPVKSLEIRKKELFIDYCHSVDNLIVAEWQIKIGRKQIESMTTVIEALNQKVSVRDEEISGFRAEVDRLNELYRASQLQFQQLKNSLSWRLTYPLRRIIDWFKQMVSKQNDK